MGFCVGVQKSEREFATGDKPPVVVFEGTHLSIFFRIHRAFGAGGFCPMLGF